MKIVIVTGSGGLVGTEAVPFLEEIITSPGSGFAEKRVAMEQLENLGRQPEAGQR